ncbi:MULTISPECIES: DUF1697 domain-containing protein [unclassified Variovorax]|uniref:DUF1697 domain-containing protein n=1 Tax=unclassified Variovorax TaxID=663243 RepID=UPI001BD26D43|nr:MULTISPECIES: DUF1697 domain-containing protein [unclassified Variovorax]
MHHAAFFRNLNLGRPNSPTRAQFEQAFIDAGAAAAQSFLTNGTIAFDAGARPVDALLDQAAQSLTACCGLCEPVFVRELASLAALADAAPFEGVDRASVYEFCITFLHADAVVPRNLPVISPRGDVQIVHVTDSEVLSVVHKFGQSPGSPNAYLEKTLGLPATTRAWNTVLRLLTRHG